MCPRIEKKLSVALLNATQDIGKATTEKELQRIANELRSVGEDEAIGCRFCRRASSRARYDDLLQMIERRKGDFEAVGRHQENSGTMAKGYFGEARQQLELARKLTPTVMNRKLLISDCRTSQDWLRSRPMPRILKKGEVDLAVVAPTYQDILATLGTAQNEFNELQLEISKRLGQSSSSQRSRTA